MLAFWMLALSGPLAELFGNPNPANIRNGWILAAVAVLAILWAVLPFRTGSAESRTAG
jgi:hypothetical protein